MDKIEMKIVITFRSPVATLTVSFMKKVRMNN